MSLQSYLDIKKSAVERTLASYLPIGADKLQVIHEAMRYSCLGGGKRLRAILAIAACEFVGGNGEDAIGYGAALEMIHAYSLVHDDLPCMDDDDFRRGKPANHKVYGEEIALLAGDALLTQAMQVLSRLPLDYNIDKDLGLRLIQEVTAACGSLGLIGGQVVDLSVERKVVDKETLTFIHKHKTADLFVVALRGGALIGGASDEQLAAISSYGEELGLAFQITDDILDVEGDQARLGKVVGSDQRKQKATYPSVYGMQEAKRMVTKCRDNCHRLLECFPQQNEILLQIANLIVNRDY